MFMVIDFNKKHSRLTAIMSYVVNFMSIERTWVSIAIKNKQYKWNLYQIIFYIVVGLHLRNIYEYLLSEIFHTQDERYLNFHL